MSSMAFLLGSCFFNSSLFASSFLYRSFFFSFSKWLWPCVSVQICLWGRNATRTPITATRPRLRCLLPSRRQHPKTSSRKILVQFTVQSLCRCFGSQRAPTHQVATSCQNQQRFGERSRPNLLSLHGCSFQLFSPSESSLARLVIHFSFTTSQL